MGISYHKLNNITKPFQFPIPRCDDAITILSWGAGEIWVISLDAHQVYHQVAVHKLDREKLEFFSPDDLKYCFNVMPFGPTNSPPFYTAMMNLKDEWDELFIIRVVALRYHNNVLITLTATNEIMIGNKLLVSGSKTIIDDILLWCACERLVMVYFECVCEVFSK